MPRISVTADHLARGKRESGGSCAVALALREQTGQPWVVCARLFMILEAGAVTHHFVPTLAVTQMIEAFDAGLPTEPLDFPFEPVVGGPIRAKAVS